LQFASLFAGIGGFDLGLERAGMECLWQVEIDKHCNTILNKQWPGIERYNDIRQCGKHNLDSVDLVCGGFPCQDLSVAGKRSGLAGKRSGLFFEFMRIVGELSPRWILIENVPGLLSSNGGQDMGTVLWEVGKFGYGWAYRVLNAQYYGVAQRRRRVFIVGCLGDAGSAAKVLFESESVCRDSPPSRETGTRVAASLTRGTDSGGKGGYAGRRREDDVNLVARPLRSQAQASHREDSDTYVIGPLCANAATDHKHGDGVITSIQQYLSGHIQPDKSSMAVRRLTPTERERLQGFPDGWTEGCSDSARYRMLGNAVAVPVAEWIGKRIVRVDIEGDFRL